MLILFIIYKKRIVRTYKKASQFRHMFIFYSILIGAIFLIGSLFFGINLGYVIYYGVLVGLGLSLIYETSRNINKKYLSKKEFFNFMITYFFIIILVIIVFSFAYITSFSLGDGFVYSNDELYIKTYWDSLYVSSLTFLSYDSSFQVEGYSKIILLFELFLSQMLILGFFFIIFGELMGKFNKKKKKRKRKSKKK